MSRPRSRRNRANLILLAAWLFTLSLACQAGFALAYLIWGL